MKRQLIIAIAMAWTTASLWAANRKQTVVQVADKVTLTTAETIMSRRQRHLEPKDW